MVREQQEGTKEGRERRGGAGAGGCQPALTDIGAQQTLAELGAVAGGRGTGLWEERRPVTAAGAAARTLSGLPSALEAAGQALGGAPEPSSGQLDAEALGSGAAELLGSCCRGENSLSLFLEPRPSPLPLTVTGRGMSWSVFSRKGGRTEW